MKKVFTLSALIAVFSFALNAQLLLEEKFDYESSTLATVAGDPTTSATNNTLKTWYKSGKAGDSNSASIALSDEVLSYNGYGASGGVKSAKIDNAGAGTNTRIDVIRFKEDASKVKTGVLYYAFLLNASNATSYASSDAKDNYDWRDYFVIAEGGSDVLGNSLRGRLFLKQDSEDETKIYYTISKNTAFNSSNPPVAQGELVAGQTYLFVIRQTFETNKIELIVNPTLTAEPTTGWIDGKPDDTNNFGGTYGIGLRRRNLASSASVLFGGIRIATNYADAIGYAPSSGVSDIQSNSNSITAFGKTIVTDRAGSIKVFSLTGAEVLSQTTSGSLNTDLSNGMYLVRFVDGAGKISASKIVIK